MAFNGQRHVQAVLPQDKELMVAIEYAVLFQNRCWHIGKGKALPRIGHEGADV